mmetsp:Transcript_23691/g.43513  ORF Transcript_23691/g.43513 Transcript_23691/m.43513 type:complete len:588 (-) Transcript_23691:266-2029(-)
MITCISIHYWAKMMGNSPTPDDAPELIDAACANIVSGTNSSEEGIEYELTDFMLLTDIEEMHSWASFQEEQMSSTSIDAPDSISIDAPASDEDDKAFEDELLAFIDSDIIDETIIDETTEAASDDEVDEDELLAFIDDDEDESTEQHLLALIDSDIIDETIDETIIDENSTAEFSGKYSVYDNYDELFFGDNELNEYLTIRDSWMEDVVDVDRVVQQDHPRDGDDCQEKRSNISTGGVDDSGSTAAADMMIEEEDEGDYQNIVPAMMLDEADENAEILKNLVLKCLARNSHKKDASLGTKQASVSNQSVSNQSVNFEKQSEKESVPMRLPRDPSMMESNEMAIALRLPRDPSMNSVNSITKERNDDSRNEEDSRKEEEEGMTIVAAWKPTRDPSLNSTKEHNKGSRNEKEGTPGEPPKRDPPEDVSRTINLPQKLRDGRLHYNIMTSHGVSSNSQHRHQPPRPNILQYGSSGERIQPSSTALSRQLSHQQSQCHQPPRPDIVRYDNNTIIQTHSQSPVNGGYPSLNVDGGYHQDDQRSRNRNSNHHYNPVVQQSLSGASILRRRRYKELLLKQRAAQTAVGIDAAAN